MNNTNKNTIKNTLAAAMHAAGRVALAAEDEVNSLRRRGLEDRALNVEARATSDTYVAARDAYVAFIDTVA